MRLTEKPPTTLNVCGKEFEIRTDYRDVLNYESLVKADASELNIIRAVDEMFLHNDLIMTADCLNAAIQCLNWFISCGEEQKIQRPSNAVLGINKNRPFEFEKDGALIYSAFIQSYDMDLYEIPYLHWWKFNALLSDVDKDSRFAKVMEYRTIDLKNKNLSKEQKKLYSALQSYYKITEGRTKEEEDFIKALLEGRDPMKK